MTNVNIPETEKTKLVWTLVFGRREEDNLSRKMMDMVVEEKKGAA